MRILIATPEANPFARAGGLAEVVSCLAGALTRLGHQVSLVMPLYRQVRECGQPLLPTGQTLSIPLSFQSFPAEIYRAEVSPGLTFYFIGQDSFFNRDGLYGTPYGDFEDNAERFIFFSRAVAEMIEVLQLDLDVCHCQEWQTGLVPVYLRTLFRDRPRARKPAVVYTVHNVGYQGLFSSYDFPLTGLGWELLNPGALEFYGKINLMKGGVVFADIINTVSNRYREEILSPEYGFGLEGVFQERAGDLFGVVEGVDYQRWDPSRDPFLAAPLRPRQPGWQKGLQGGPPQALRPGPVSGPAPGVRHDHPHLRKEGRRPDRGRHGPAHGPGGGFRAPGHRRRAAPVRP